VLDPHVDAVQRDNAAKAALDRPAFEYWGVAAILEGQLDPVQKINLLKKFLAPKQQAFGI
jgi:hypothetical protein